MIQYGMPTLIGCPDLQDSIALCRELGLDFIEINMNLPQYQLDIFDIQAAQKAIENSGLYLTIHLDENLNICDFNPLVAKAYTDTVLKTIDLAKKLNIPILNMHMPEGVYFTLPHKKAYLFEIYRDRYLKQLDTFRNLCKQAVGDTDITLCIENCNAYHGFQKEGIELLLQSKRFGLTFDIGHDHCHGNANEPFIMAHANRLLHMHLHDATQKGNHLPLGAGEIDICSKLKIAKTHGCRCVLETKTAEGLRQSVKQISKYEV